MKKLSVLFVILVSIMLCAVAVAADSIIGITEAKTMSDGNIFFDGDEKKFVVTYSNSSDSEITVNVSYDIKDAEEQNTDTVYLSKNTSLQIGANTSIDDTFAADELKRYGVYRLCINAQTSDGQNFAQKEIPFSVCVNASQSGGNPSLGVSFHISWGDRLPDTALALVKKSGFTSVRDSYLWNAYETQKGVYSEPKRYTELYNAIKQNGLNICAISAWGNVLYGMETDNHMPNTDAQRKAYADYIYDMLLKHSDTVEVVEVWNEPDLSGFNPSQESPEVYAKLVRCVYEKIHSNSEFSHIQIAGPVLAGSTSKKGKAWLEAFLNADTDGDGAADMYKYFDLVTIHNYIQAYSSIYHNLNYIKPLLEKYNCGNKKVYYTEFGTHQDYANDASAQDVKTNEHMQASRILRYYLTLDAQDIGDKYYLYTFSNEPLAVDYSEKTFGITQAFNTSVPYAAKASLVAAANLNNLLCEDYTDELTTYTELDNQVCVAEFVNPSGNRAVKAFFRTFATGSEELNAVSYRLAADEFASEIRFLDMYGNPIFFSTDGEYYDLEVSYDPIFAVYDYSDDVNVYTDNGRAYVYGAVPASKADEFITVRVTDQSGMLVYIDEARLGDAKEFEFSFKVNDMSEQYLVYLGNTSFKGIYSLAFAPCSLSKVAIAAVDGNNVVLSGVTDYISADQTVIKSKVMDPNIGKFSIIVAYYNDNKLEFVQKAEISDMEESNGIYKYALDPVGNTLSYDTVKVFVLNDLNELTPLSKNIILN